MKTLAEKPRFRPRQRRCGVKSAKVGLTELFQCAVVGPMSVAGTPARPAVPDHTLLFLTCDSAGEAYFLAGVLNSLPSRVALYSASVGVQTQRYFPTDVSRLCLPRFKQGNQLHCEIADISKACHKAATDDPEMLVEREEKLANAVARLYGISARELEVLSAYRDLITTFRRRVGRSPEPSEEAEE